jgi:hypothetical protein
VNPSSSTPKLWSGMRTLCTLPKTSPCTLCQPKALRASAPHTRPKLFDKWPYLFLFANDLLLILSIIIFPSLLWSSGVGPAWRNLNTTESTSPKTPSFYFCLSFVLHYGSLLSLRSFGFILGHRREVEIRQLGRAALYDYRCRSPFAGSFPF